MRGSRPDAIVMSVVWVAMTAGAWVVVGTGGAATTTETAVMRGFGVKSGVEGAAGVGIQRGPAKATEARARAKGKAKSPRILVVV